MVTAITIVELPGSSLLATETRDEKASPGSLVFETWDILNIDQAG